MKGVRFMKTISRSVLLFSVVALAAAGAGYASESGGWIPLFDGKTLNGWKANEQPDSFRIEDGAIVCGGTRCHLFYVGNVQNAQFKNFEFKADVMAKPGANSGIFIHTRFQNDGWPNYGYEVQVDNTQPLHNGYKEMKKTGSLYGIRNVYKQLVQDNEWFTLTIVVRGKRIVVKINDTLVVDYIEPDRPARKNRTVNWVLSSGTFALQSHDPDSVVHYKNISVRPLPDNLPPDGAEAPNVDETYSKLIQLGGNNFPLVDLHIHLKGGLTIEEALANSRKTGINYGIAPNCGLGFPITNDEGIYEFIQSMNGKPVFLGMQAEGREWVNLFSKKAISQFDYVFSDAMTFTDDNGKRIRLWIKEDIEPIDIYVNPTYLPEVIADEYDKLWTPERMQKVIDSAVKNEVAVEINSRFKIPSQAFIKQAKKSGSKFTLGTNNGGRELGRMEYGLKMVESCKLSWKDMFVPEPKSR